MKLFPGFPTRMEFAALPAVFFSALLPEIDDMAELKTTLHVLAALCRKKGYPRFVTMNELLDNAGLVAALHGLGKPAEILPGALKTATERGTLIEVRLERDGKAESVYLVNSEADRKAAARIESGELVLHGFDRGRHAPEMQPQPDIFSLYERNIGMLTPMIADELREAEKAYPDSWLRDAIKEAVALNKRSWRYIARILERWAVEGKSDGAHRRDNKEDPDKYIKGKYGEMVQR